MLRTLQGRGYIDAVGRDPGPGQAVLYGTTPAFLEKLGLDTVDDLPPIAEFIPGADVVEALEAGLRVARCRRPGLSRRSGSSSRRGAPVSALQKVLAARGWGSRRVCEELIAAGRVTVNGEVAVLGRRVDPDVDLVEVDGAPVGTKAGPRLLPAQQAAPASSRRPRTPTAARPSSSSCPPSRGCSRSAASTPTPRACCC